MLAIYLWTEVIKCGFEADALLTFFRWCDFRDVLFLVLGFEREVDRCIENVHGVISSVAVFETLCVVFEQLCKLRAFMHNDFCLEMSATSKDKPCHIEAIARDQHFRAVRNVGTTLRFDGGLSIDDKVHRCSVR